MAFVQLSWISLWFWGRLGSLWEDYALLTGSLEADGALEQCWDGFPQARMIWERLGKAVVGVFSQNCPPLPQFADS